MQTRYEDQDVIIGRIKEKAEQLEVDKRDKKGKVYDDLDKTKEELRLLKTKNRMTESTGKLRLDEIVDIKARLEAADTASQNAYTLNTKRDLQQKATLDMLAEARENYIGSMRETAELREVHEGLTDKYEKLEASYITLENKFDSVSIEKQNLEEQLVNVPQQLKLVAQIATDEARAKHEKLDTSHTTLQREFGELSVEHRSLQAKERNLEEQLAQLSSTQNELKLTQTKHEKLDASYTTLQQQFNEISVEHRNLQAKERDFSQKQREQSTITQTSSDINDTNELKAKLAIANRELFTLKNKHASTLSELDTAKKQAHTAKQAPAGNFTGSGASASSLYTEWAEKELLDVQKYLPGRDNVGFTLSHLENYCTALNLTFANEVIRRRNPGNEEVLLFLGDSVPRENIQAGEYMVGRLRDREWWTTLSSSDKQVINRVDALFKAKKPTTFADARLTATKFLVLERAITLGALQNHPWTKRCDAEETIALIVDCIALYDVKFCSWIFQLTHQKVTKIGPTRMGLCQYTAQLGGLDMRKVFGALDGNELARLHDAWWTTRDP